MFVPAMYQVDHEGWPAEVIDRYPLALLVSGGDIPQATHVPVIRQASQNSLVGAELLTHMNRANPHWATLADGTPAKLVFQGPQGYVSPSSYRIDPTLAVPTWNFVAVHVTGTLTTTEDNDEVLAIVTATARALEGRFGAGFDVDAAAEHHAIIASGVGAMRVRVTAVDTMFKLSQEKKPAIRARVACWLADSGTSAELAELMWRYPDGTLRHIES